MLIMDTAMSHYHQHTALAEADFDTDENDLVRAAIACIDDDDTTQHEPTHKTSIKSNSPPRAQSLGLTGSMWACDASSSWNQTTTTTPPRRTSLSELTPPVVVQSTLRADSAAFVPSKSIIQPSKPSSRSSSASPPKQPAQTFVSHFAHAPLPIYQPYSHGAPLQHTLYQTPARVSPPPSASGRQSSTRRNNYPMSSVVSAIKPLPVMSVVLG
jgi:hypothetical protein